MVETQSDNEFESASDKDSTDGGDGHNPEDSDHGNAVTQTHHPQTSLPKMRHIFFQESDGGTSDSIP